MYKIKKKRKLFAHTPLSSVRGQRKALYQRRYLYNNLIEKGEFRTPYWWRRTARRTQQSLEGNYAFNLHDTRVLTLKKNKSLKISKLLKSPLRSAPWFLRKFKKIAQRKLRKPYFRRIGRWLGPRTQRHWWLYPKIPSTYAYFQQMRKKSSIYISKKKSWAPTGKKNPVRSFLYVSKKIFKTYYWLLKDQKLKILLKKIRFSKKSNKVNLLFSFLESKVAILLIRMGLVKTFSRALFYIKFGIVYVNGKRVKTPMHQVKPNDFVQIRYQYTNLPKHMLNKIFRQAGLASFRKKKHYKHLHTSLRSMGGILLEYPNFYVCKDAYGFSEQRLIELFNYIVSQARNV